MKTGARFNVIATNDEIWAIYRKHGVELSDALLADYRAGPGIFATAALAKNTPRGGATRIFMSVAMLSRVWRQSKTRGGPLLVLLAIADFANDAGQAWPSVKTLAAKSRLSERETRYILRRLERSGEVKILHNKGPHGCHLFQLNVADQKGAEIAGGQKLPGAISRKGGAILGTLGGQCTAPEPSENRHKNHQSSLAQPSADAAASAESILSRAQEDAFAAFWSAYPKKRGKLDAKRAWKARKPPLQKVLNTLAGLSASHEWRKDNGQFIPYPASWLNAGGWDDEPASVAPPPESFI